MRNNAPLSESTSYAYPSKVFTKGDVLFRKGDKARKAYLLREGRVELSSEAGGEKVVVATLDETAIFGEMALLLPDHLRTATATVLAPSQIIVIHQQAFDAFVARSPTFVRCLLESLTRRLKDTTDRSVRVPSTFRAACRILAATSLAGKGAMDFWPLVEHMAAALRTDKFQIVDAVERLRRAELVRLDETDESHARLRLKDPGTFLARALELSEDEDPA